MQELKVRGHLKDLRVHGRTTLKPILQKQNMKFQMRIIRRTTGGQWPDVVDMKHYVTKSAEVLTSWATISFTKRLPIIGITICCIPCEGCGILETKHCGICSRSVARSLPTNAIGRGRQKDRYKPPRLATELCNSRLTNLMAATPIKLV